MRAARILALTLSTTATALAQEPLVIEAPAPDPPDLVVVLGSAPVEIVVPVGVAADLLLRHEGGVVAGYAATGGPSGLVVGADGRFLFDPVEAQAGGQWVVRVDAGSGLPAVEPASASLLVRVVPEGSAVQVLGAEVAPWVEPPPIVLVPEPEPLVVAEPIVAEPVVAEPPAEPDLAVLPAEPAIEAPPAERRHRKWPVYVYGSVLGAFIGGTAGFAIGDAAGGPEGEGPGVGAGVLLGSGVGLGTTALVVGLRPELKPTGEQVLLLSSTSAMGAFTGWQISRAIIPVDDKDSPRRIALSGMLGAIGGTGVGILWSPKTPPAKVMAHFDLGAVVGWQAAAGALDMALLDESEDRRIRAPVTLAGAYAVGVTAGLLRAFDVPAPSPGLLAVSMSEGAWIGAWAPLLVTQQPDGLQVAGGLRLGIGAGYALAQALAPLGRVSGRSAALQGVGFAAGNALGAGIPLAAGVDPLESDATTRQVVAPMLAGSVAGIALGAAVAPHYELTDNDIGLLTTLGVWTGWQALGWGIYAGVAQERGSVAAGHALTAAGAGTLIATAVAPFVDVTPAESLMAASMGGWGTYYGAWIGHLARLDPQGHWALTLSAGDLALLGTAIVLASPVESDWIDLAFVDGATFTGGAIGSLVGIIASPEVDPVAIGGIVGATVGMGTGIFLAARRPPVHEVDAVALGIPFPRLDLPVQASVQALPWLDEDGNPGVWVQVDVLEKERR